MKKGSYTLLYKPSDTEELVLRPAYFLNKYKDAMARNQGNFCIVVHPDLPLMQQYGFDPKEPLPPLGRRTLFPHENLNPGSPQTPVTPQASGISTVPSNQQSMHPNVASHPHPLAS